MSTEEKKPELKPVGAEVTYSMPTTNALAQLKDAGEGRSLTSKYMTMEDWAEKQDQEFLCFFVGFKEAIGQDGKSYHMAKLVDSHSNPFVAAQTILCQSLSQTAVGQGVKIICKGVEKSTQGKMVNFEVIELDVNLFLTGE